MTVVLDLESPSSVGYSATMDTSDTSAFRGDHPDRDRTVFLAMRFAPLAHLVRLRRMLTEVATHAGFDLVRADDRDYTGELWNNARICMQGSGLAVAVFDADAENSQNMAVELGFIFALGTPCLILREQRLPRMPAAMIAHRIHTAYDERDLEGTAVPALAQWLNDQKRRQI